VDRERRGYVRRGLGRGGHSDIVSGVFFGGGGESDRETYASSRIFADMGDIKDWFGFSLEDEEHEARLQCGKGGFMSWCAG
jgi:hypothetical protein